MNTAEESLVSRLLRLIGLRKKEELLPSFAALYFNLLVGEYESIKDRPCYDQEANKVVRELSKKYEEHPKDLTWGDLCELDRLVLRLRTIDEIRERIPALESRYVEIAGPSSYVAYLRKFPVSQVDPEEQLRARIDGLVSEFYRFCMVAASRERLRDRASRRLSCFILSFLILFLFSGWLNQKLYRFPDQIPILAAESGEQVSTSAPTAPSFTPTMGSRLSGTAIGGLILTQAHGTSGWLVILPRFTGSRG